MMKKKKEEVKHLDVLMWVDDEPKVEEKMVYYVKRDKKIEKYLVKVDMEKLAKIERKIALKCPNPADLLRLTEKLRNNDATVIDELYNYADRKKLLKEQIDYTDKKLNNVSDSAEFNVLFLNMKDLAQALNDFEEKIPYIEKIKSVITFKLIGTISKKEVKEVNKFYETEDTTVYGKIKIKKINKK